MLGITIVRLATVDDVPGIRAVLAVTWRDTYGAFVLLEAFETNLRVIVMMCVVGAVS